MAEKAKGNGNATVPAKGKSAAMSKMEAVRKAMATLGWETGRAAIRDYVKSEFGIEMSADHVSTCRADILRQRAVKGTTAAAKASPAKPVVAPAPAAVTVAPKAAPAKTAPVPAKAPVSAARNGSGRREDGIRLEDILAVKDLVGRVGSGHLKALIDAFGE